MSHDRSLAIPSPRTGVVIALAALWAAGAAVGQETTAPTLTGPSPPPRATPTADAIEAAITRGVDWLIARQNPDGSWGGPGCTKDLNIFAPVPGGHDAFLTATSALCLSALLEANDPRPEAQAAIARGETWLLTHLPRLRRANPVAIYNVWGHAYGIRALCGMHAEAAGDADRQATIDKALATQIDLLRRYEAVNGGWCYYDFQYGTQKPSGTSTSFITATALVALRQAADLGMEVPDRLVDRAVDSLQRQRNPDFTYLYGENFKYSRLHPINRPGGSLGRSQACNLALRLWGDEAVTDQVMEVWLDRLAARNGWLSIGRKKPAPHESWFAVSGYFYYYGHYYAAQCIELLPEEARPRHRADLAAILLEHQETDGSWFDYALYDYGHSYSTGYALYALVHCRPED